MPVYYWFPILGCLGIGFMFMNIPPVATQFMQLFHVGYSGLSFLLSALFWTHALGQIPAGLIIDRLGILRSLVISTVLCTVCSLAPFLAPHNLALAIVMRLVVGMASAMLFLGVVSVVKVLAPPQFLARAQGMQGAAFSLGTMVPYLVLPFFEAQGWVVSYIMVALMPALLLLALLWTPRAPLRQKTAPGNNVSIWLSLKSVARSKQLWFLGCCHGFSFGTITALGSWLPTVLADRDQNNGPEHWALATGVVLLAGTFARIGGGEMGGRSDLHKLLTRLVLGISLLYTAMALMPGPLTTLAAGVCLAVFCGGTYAAVFVLTIRTTGPGLVATGVGFMATVACLINVLLTLLMGNMREYAGSFGPALLVTALCTAALYLWGRRLCRDGSFN